MKGARVHCRVSVFRISAVLGWEESPPKITYRPKICSKGFTGVNDTTEKLFSGVNYTANKHL